MTHAERDRLIQQYAEGPALLRAAWMRVPAEARQWRPAPGRWSAHEVVVHCADSECNAVGRIRYLLAEPDPLVLGYDQDRWATVLDYHALPVEPALPAVEAVRANTLPLLVRLTDDELARMGRHTEVGALRRDGLAPGVRRAPARPYPPDRAQPRGVRPPLAHRPLDLRRLPRRPRREDLGARRGDQDVVLDPHAERLLGNVDPRLDREDHARPRAAR